MCSSTLMLALCLAPCLARKVNSEPTWEGCNEREQSKWIQQHVNKVDLCIAPNRVSSNITRAVPLFVCSIRCNKGTYVHTTTWRALLYMQPAHVPPPGELSYTCNLHTYHHCESSPIHGTCTRTTTLRALLYMQPAHVPPP